MSSDFETYEQDFGTLTAEITSRIGKIPKLGGDEKKNMVVNVEKQLEEARELLEQMDLEVREIPVQSRGMHSTRLKSYKQELEKLEKDFKRSRIAYSDEVRDELLGDDGNSSASQRAHLLDNAEKLERSSRRLEAGYQIAVETEQVGQEILENLHHDREKIQRSRDRLRETDANLGKSSRILTGMLRSVSLKGLPCSYVKNSTKERMQAVFDTRIIQNRILMFILGVIILFTVVLAIYFSVRGL
ncbi:vesicle transport through interaction with t-SNAREs-like protein 1A-like isoform X2 [Huso huso]|uniref:Vesicle transport through interaction with t-SNAREs-like protein 1A-like isoform X2 n=1 Tax=Huso huso TaxID=61971 RepID=A0ABR0ZR51_HUSHU